MTQRDQILAHLQRGESITPLDALQLYGCFALSQRIGELKRLGHPIASELVKDGRKHYARYWLIAGPLFAGVECSSAAYCD